MSVGDIIGKLKAKLSGGKSGTAATPAIDKAVLVSKVRESDIFSNLSDENIAGMLDHMETVSMAAGQTVVKEGDEGDYYYLVVSGTADVLRQLPGQAKPEKVAELSEGGSFGEEALISNSKRNATITMKTSGSLMRLSKDAFNDFVKEPLIVWLAPADAQRKVEEGAVWLDVRDDASPSAKRLTGAAVLPLNVLRDKVGELDKDTFYVCYCQNARQSSTAAFLLGQRDFKCAVLRGGMKGMERANLL